MEGAIQTVVKAYLKSTKGGDLSGRDFDNLVKKQLGNVLSDTDSKAKLQEMRKGLDENQDGKVSFEEYMTLIGYLATSMSDAKTRDRAKENNKAAAPTEQTEQPKVEEKEAAVALPEPVAAAVSAAAALVEEEKPKEKVEGAIASVAAEVDAKVEEATS